MLHFPNFHSKFTCDSPPVNLSSRNSRDGAKIKFCLVTGVICHQWNDLRQSAKGVARIPKSFIPTVLLRWFIPYVSAQNRDKKLISKRQVAELFGVSTHTIDCWLHDGKLPEPKRTVLWAARWDYEELVARTRLKSSSIASVIEKNARESRSFWKA